MTDKNAQVKNTGKSAADARAARLKAALKANIAKRKSQARARVADTSDASDNDSETEQGQR